MDQNKQRKQPKNEKDEAVESSTNISTSDPLSKSIASSVRNVLTINPEVDVINNMLNCIVNALPGCAFIKSANNLEYLMTNQNSLDMLGMKDKSQLIGQTDHNVASYMKWRWPAGFADDLQEMDSKVIYNNSQVIGKEHQPYVNAEGVLIAHSITKIPLFYHDETPFGVLSFIINTTSLKNSDKLRELYRQFYNDEKLAHKKFLDHIGINSLTNIYSNEKNMITIRELDVLTLLAKGKTAKEVAKLMNISNRTVETHIEKAKNKLNCNSKSDLIGLFVSCYRIY